MRDRITNDKRPRSGAGSERTQSRGAGAGDREKQLEEIQAMLRKLDPRKTQLVYRFIKTLVS